MAEKQFKVQTPDGKFITVTAPENATDAEIEALAAAQFYKTPTREKVDLTPDPNTIRVLQAEYQREVQRILDARAKGDADALRRAEVDRASVARELQRLGPNLIPGADTTPEPRAAAPTPAQSLASRAREATQNIDPTRALIDLAAATTGAGGSQMMQGLMANVQGGPTTTRTGTPVEKWAGAMGYGNRGGRTFSEAHQMEQGLRKGAKIGGVQPEFRFAKPPTVEPAMAQRVGQSMMGAPKTVGALGGLGMAESGMEAMRRMEQGDPIGAAIAGAGALGGGAAMVPTPATRLGGTALGMASPLSLYLLDKMRSRGVALEEAQRALTGVDLMGNPMP
jgi:hypothetical protein